MKKFVEYAMNQEPLDMEKNIFGTYVPANNKNPTPNLKKLVIGGALSLITTFAFSQENPSNFNLLYKMYYNLLGANVNTELTAKISDLYGANIEGTAHFFSDFKDLKNMDNVLKNGDIAIELSKQGILSPLIRYSQVFFPEQEPGCFQFGTRLQKEFGNFSGRLDYLGLSTKDIGAEFSLGLEYLPFKFLSLGLDAKYNLKSNDINGNISTGFKINPSSKIGAGFGWDPSLKENPFSFTLGIEQKLFQ